MFDRRSFLCGLAALPLLGGSVAIVGQPAVAAALPVAFDPAVFVADLMGAGYEVTAYRSVPLGREERSRPSYYIQPPSGRGFGEAYFAIVARWTDAMDACPDHVERVVAYVFDETSS